MDLYSQISGLLLSTSAQLEFLTLLGIIINGVMQGYVTANTIYVFLIENVLDKLHASCGITKSNEGGGQSQDRLYEFHAARIHSTME